MLSVASVTETGQPSAFSMSGPWIGIAAPGEHIVSLANNPDTGIINGQPSPQGPLVPINGTSLAAAYVAGVAALLRAAHPELTSHQIIYRLTATAHNPARTPSNRLGAGIIDPVAALTWQIPPADPLPAHAPTTRIAAPPEPPPDHRRATLITLAAGTILIAAAVAVQLLVNRRRRK